jgi:H+/Cl- antiporter ClcA
MEWTSQQPNFTNQALPKHFSFRFWLAAGVAGVAAGVAAGLLMKLLRLVQHLAWAYQSGDFLSAVEHSSARHRVLLLSLAGGLTAGGLWLARRFWPKPGWGLSSGIWLHAGALPLLASLYNGVLSVILVSLGAALGRESAPKEAGAAFAASLADLGRLTLPERQLLAACGAGAGMAAVYNVPFGGALFALEVLLGSLALPAVLPALVVSFIATWVSWLLLPQAPTFVVPVAAVTTGMLVWSVLFGLLAGVVSVGYVRLIGRARRAKPTGPARLWLPLVVFAGLGLAAILFPELLGNGRNVVQQAIDSRLSVLLFAGLLLLRPLATAACLRTGAPGGLFTPTLTFGALLGGLAGRGWAIVWPAAVPGSSLGAYAVVGAGAILASATQAPLSSILLMLELGTHVDKLLMPLLIATAVATHVSRRLEARSIYAVAGPAHEIPPTPAPRGDDWHAAITS